MRNFFFCFSAHTWNPNLYIIHSETEPKFISQRPPVFRRILYTLNHEKNNDDDNSSSNSLVSKHKIKPLESFNVLVAISTSNQKVSTKPTTSLVNIIITSTRRTLWTCPLFQQLSAASCLDFPMSVTTFSGLYSWTVHRSQRIAQILLKHSLYVLHIYIYYPRNRYSLAGSEGDTRCHIMQEVYMLCLSKHCILNTGWLFCLRARQKLLEIICT